jgi:tetratricopeptide (TPR) repeat protein
MLRSIIEIDPLDENLQMSYAGRLFDNEEFQAAESVVNHLLELNPSLNFGPAYLAWLDIYDDQLDEALQHAEAEPVDFARLTALAIIHQKLGNTEAASEAQQELLDIYGDLAAYQQAQIFAFWGESDEAIRWLQKAYDGRDPGMAGIKVDIVFEPLREHPEFIALLEKINL